MHRFYLRTDAGVGDIVALSEDDSHHAARVLRMAEGDSVEILDGSGRCLGGRVLEVHKRATRVRVASEARRPAPPRVVLAPSWIKGKAMDFLVQKATELGVARLSPLMTERAVVKASPEEGPKRVDDWTRTAVEACKQCGNPWMPRIDEPMSLGRFLATRSPGLLLVASLRADSMSLRRVLDAAGPGDDDVALVLGPEGDFTPSEEDSLRAEGARPISLGPLVLRAETAAIAGLAMIQYELSLRRDQAPT
ncbi:MAG: 16S rRNA (uracil(1498)-N(3))-methyltransferase [Verrucomicrobiales bacterium]|nr:16S rRNA (uracil(1498)-N(3))-methyltransferase [Verrucomicrobiales bacterium]